MCSQGRTLLFKGIFICCLFIEFKNSVLIFLDTLKLNLKISNWQLGICKADDRWWRKARGYQGFRNRLRCRFAAHLNVFGFWVILCRFALLHESNDLHVTVYLWLFTFNNNHLSSGNYRLLPKRMFRCLTSQE